MYEPQLFEILLGQFGKAIFASSQHFSQLTNAERSQKTSDILIELWSRT